MSQHYLSCPVPQELSAADPVAFGGTMRASFPEISVLGTMMDFPLTLVPILERAGKLYGQVEIVSRRPDRTIARTNYGAI